MNLNWKGNPFLTLKQIVMEKLISFGVKCPKCRTLLMNKEKTINGKPSIELDIEFKGVKGKLYMCSRYGCFDHESDIKVDHDEIANLYCPHCSESLVTDVKCEACDAPMITFGIQSGGRVSFCSRHGCNKHYVAFQNLDDAIRKFHEEFSDYAADL